MKTIADVIIVSLAVVLLLIALHQTVMVGFGQSYWLYMLTVGLFLLYVYRKIPKT